MNPKLSGQALAWPVTALGFFGGRKSALNGGGAGMSKLTDVFV